MLRQREPVPMGQLRSWLRRHLGIGQQSYGSDSEEEELTERPAAAGRPQQQPQQPQQQQQQQAPLRRSSRPNLGQVSSDFASLYGTTMGADSARKVGGDGGKGTSTAQPCTATPLTPAAAAPAARDSRRRRRPKR
jgi:hypothetical protein